MRTTTIVLASLFIATTALASEGESPGAASSSIRPFVGAFIPTGAQHKELSRSVLTGAQVGYDLPNMVRLVGSFGWMPSHDRDLADARWSIYQYDAGVELARREAIGAQWNLIPFLGAGLGGRTYRLKGFSASDQTDFDGYGSVGGELDRNQFGARLELRDYVSRFKDVAGLGQSSTRNDLALTGALTVHL